eukprot:jgi/Mesvir1/17476/Mv08749-RA.1
MSKTPVVFVTHGGGPMPVLGDPSHTDITKHLKALGGIIAAKVGPPKAIVVISAHWEAGGPEVLVSSAEQPEMIYDYGGFPSEAYKLKYPAKGSPELAHRVQELLILAGIRSRTDSTRGFDHGVFVPLMLAYPAADVPVVTLSLDRSLDAQKHLDIGRAIAPLRDENVLIFGSGASFHNLRAIFSRSPQCMAWSLAFDSWLVDVCAGAKNAEDRANMLAGWERLAPHARESHPREEHLLPLMVAVGAAGGDPGKHINGCDIMNHRVSSFLFSE